MIRDPAQQSLFDPVEAERRKQRGIRQVEKHNSEWVARAKDVAAEVARIRGTVTADDVRAMMYPDDMPRHSNAFGLIFRGSRFRWTGAWKKSKVPQGHGNMQRVWKLN